MESRKAHSPRLSVTIVVYNSPLAMLNQTLESLFDASTYLLGAGLGEMCVQLVDNCSSPAYREQLAQLLQDRAWPGLGLTLLDKNLGFGAGQNVALGGTVGDYHLILNPDVELASDALSKGLQIMAGDPSIVLLSPFATGSDGEREFLCKRYPSVAVLGLRAFFPRLGQRFFPAIMSHYNMSDVCTGKAPVEIPLASGCFMLVRGAAFEQVGGFDESYFLYFEDFDLSLRLGKLGRLSFEPSVRIVHHGGYAASKGWRHLKLFASSALHFFKCHGWRWI